MPATDGALIPSHNLELGTQRGLENKLVKSMSDLRVKCLVLLCCVFVKL